MQLRPKYVHVVANPAKERRAALLTTLNNRFRPVGIEWQVSVTHHPGDAKKYAAQAVKNGAEVVASFGGDGTVMEVAGALAGTKVPLLILPGGTGNLVAQELGVPPSVSRACKRLTGETIESRPVDVGRMGNHHFLLRVGCGFETDVLQDATRELKNQFGKWAYVFASIKALQQIPVANYRLTLDNNEVVESRGIACAVANAGTIGIGKLVLSRAIDIDDGKLDVILIRSGQIDGILELASKVMGLQRGEANEPEAGLDASHLVNHWQVDNICIESDPIQGLQADGDLIAAETPQTIEVLPKALHVVI
ncbi:MAG: diacylglycerol kinase family protein [Verrucomicrobiota bacterium]